MSKIEIRGVIVPSDYDTEWAIEYIERGLITPESYFRRMLDEAATDEPLNVYVNSPGGSVFAANEMINAVRDWKMANNQTANVTVGAMAASAASAFCIMAADVINAHSNAKMMFHGAYTLTIGGKEVHEDTADLLAKINGDIQTRLVSKYNLAPETVSEWFAEGREGWLTAGEMVDTGIAASVIEDDAEAIEFPIGAVNDIEQRGLGIAALLQANTDDAKYDCECMDCGHTESGDEHCADLTCSECGGQMRRADRPGRGRQESGMEVDDASDDTTEDVEADGDDDDDTPAVAAEVTEPEAIEDEPEPESEVSADEPSETSEMTKDEQARFEAGRTMVMDEMVPKLESLQGKLAEADAQTRKMQSERDKITDEYAKAKDRHDGLVAEMTEKLKVANDRLAKFLNGGLTFSPTAGSWLEALKECGGDYAQAASRYPELRDKYNQDNAHK